MLKKVVSDESGRILGWTLVMLGIGALLIPALLTHVSANLTTTRAIEESLKEQYAADAGVEYALLLMSEGEYELGEPFNTPTSVNNLPVSVMITVAAEDVYQIVSEAGGTGIESNVTTNYSNLSWLLDNAITSKGDVTIQPGSIITGDVQYVDSFTCPPDPPDLCEEKVIKGGFSAEQDSSILADWPSVSDLSDFYFMDVQDLEPSNYDDDSPIDVASGTEANPYPIGPLYYVGDPLHPLEIKSTLNEPQAPNAIAVLSGTVYVAVGDLDIGGAKDFTLDLNGQTIYVKGGIDVEGSCTIRGSGCIIAEGNIFFEPNSVLSSEDEFALVMSVNGTSKINPSSDFFGAVVGDAWVNLQPGNALEWTNPYDKGLNFPNGTKGFLAFQTYRIYIR